MAGIAGMRWDARRKGVRDKNRNKRELRDQLDHTPTPAELAVIDQIATNQVLIAGLAERLLLDYEAEAARSYTNLQNTTLALRRELGLVSEEPETQPRARPPEWLRYLTDDELEQLHELMLRAEQRRVEQAQATPAGTRGSFSKPGGASDTGPPSEISAKNGGS